MDQQNPHFFYHPRGIAIDSKGNMYIVDTLNKRIRKLSTDGIVTTIGTTDEATNPFLEPIGIAIDSHGNLLVSDSSYDCIFKIDQDGTVTPWAGIPRNRGCVNGPLCDARFDRPWQMATTPFGDVIVADHSNNVIRMISADGVVSILAGTPSNKGSKDGPADEALFEEPYGVAVDRSGNIYVTDIHQVRKIFKLIWSPNTHKQFPEPIKQEINAMMMVAWTSECGSLLGTLPRELLFVIFQFVATQRPRKAVQVDEEDGVTEPTPKRRKLFSLE